MPLSDAEARLGPVFKQQWFSSRICWLTPIVRFELQEKMYQGNRGKKYLEIDDYWAEAVEDFKETDIKNWTPGWMTVSHHMLGPR